MRIEPIGIIETNYREGKFVPLTVNLDEGSWWKGFESMVSLGMQHIKEGTDFALIIPWLIVLSKTPSYTYFRIAGATLSAIAAIGWIVERSTGKANFITNVIT